MCTHEFKDRKQMGETYYKVPGNGKKSITGVRANGMFVSHNTIHILDLEKLEV